MKHTPGPWIWKQNRGNNKFEHCVLKEDDYRIVIADLNGTDPEEIKANARLIAAAPELLKILEEMEKVAIALADNAPTEYKNKQNDLFADVHNAHLHAIEIIKKATKMMQKINAAYSILMN